MGLEFVNSAEGFMARDHEYCKDFICAELKIRINRGSDHLIPMEGSEEGDIHICP